MEELIFPDDRGCFGCSASNQTGIGLRFFGDGQRVVSRHTIAQRFHGAPDIAHGGIVATIFDEVSCAVVFFGRRTYVVTGELTVRYEAPCPVEKEIEFTAWIEDDSHERYAVVHSEARLADRVIARSHGRFFYQGDRAPSSLTYAATSVGPCE